MSEKIELPASAPSDDSGRFAPDTSDTKDVKTEAAVVGESDATDHGGLDNDNPFADPNIAAHYAELYEKSQYECRHVFDPTLTWSAEEEKNLVRKLDWHVCLWAVSLFSF